MENAYQERHSGIKLTIILLCLVGFGWMNVVSTGKDINLNLNDPNVIDFMKLAQFLGVVIIFIVPAVLFATLFTRQKIHYLGATTVPSAATMLLAGLSILFALPAINWLSEINQHMQLPSFLHGMEVWMQQSEDKAAELTEAFTKGTTTGVLISNLIVVALMAALSEELFFRGMLQKVSIEVFKNPHAGIWFAAIIFSAFHMQFYGFLPRMLMGAFLGYLFYWSGSLWPGILAHFINNGTAVYISWLINRGELAQGVDTVGADTGEISYAILSFALVGAGLFAIWKNERRRRALA